MAAGNSDYSGVAQGQLGQGFAQGVQQGTDNYNKGLDRKVAQANTYLTNFIGPNLARLGKAEPRPGPDATPDEHLAWARREEARQRQLQAVLKQSGSYLKETGSPISPEEWAGLWYDPSEAVKPEEMAKISSVAAQFGTVSKQVEDARNRLAKLDPTSETYKTARAEYLKLIESTGYAEMFKTVTGVEYREPVDSENFLLAAKVEKRKAEDQPTILGAINSSDPDVAAEGARIRELGVPLDAVDPNTGQTYRTGLLNLVKDTNLVEMATSGDPSKIAMAVAKLDNMAATSPDKFRSLDPQLKVFYDKVTAYRKDPTSLADSDPVKAALSTIALPTQQSQKLGMDIKIGGITYQTSALEYKAAFGELAAKGNGAVFAGKDDFYKELGDMPQAEKDKLWNSTVVEPYNRAVEQKRTELATSKAQLATVNAQNLNSLTDSIVQKGTFHLLMGDFDETGKFIPDKDSLAYKNMLNIVGNEQLLDGQLQIWAEQSRTRYNQVITDQDNATKSGAAILRSQEANATISEVQAEYAGLMAALDYEGKNLDVGMKRIEAAIAPAMAKGRVTVLLGEAVKMHGAGILEDDTFKAPFIEAMGEDAYNAAKRYAVDEQEFKDWERTDTKKWSGIKAVQTYLSDAGMLRTLAQDPALMRKLAADAGLNVDSFILMVTKLAKEGSTLKGLELETMTFRLTEGQTRLRMDQDHENWLRATDARDYAQRKAESDRNYGLSVRGMVLQENEFNYRKWLDATNLRWDKEKFQKTFGLEWAEFQNMTEQQRISWSWKQKEFVTQMAQWGKEYALRYASEYRAANNDRANQQIAIQGLKANVLTPLAQQATNIKAMQDQAQTVLNAEYAAGGTMQAYMTTAYSQKFKIVDGKVTGIEGENYPFTPADLAKLTAWNTARKDVVGATNDLKTINSTLSQITSEFMGNYGGNSNDPYNLFGDLMNGQGQPRSSNPQGQGALPPITNVSSATGADIIKSLTGIVDGTGQRYANWDVPGYCLTLVQNIMNDKIDWTKVTGGGPIVGGYEGARNWYRQMKTAGAIQVKGGQQLSASEISKLPDGTILFQNTPEVEGHIAIVVNGKVIQNSRYPNDKTIAGAVGIMEPKDFVAGGAVFGIQIPNDWWKKGSGPTSNAKAQGSGKPAPAPKPQPKPAPQVTYSKEALYKWVQSAAKLPGGKVDMVDDLPSNTKIGKFTVEMGPNQYAVMNDDIAVGYVTRAVPSIEANIRKATGSSQTIGAALKKDPSLRPAVRNMLIVEMSKLATGDVAKIVDLYMKKMGW